MVFPLLEPKLSRIHFVLQSFSLISHPMGAIYPLEAISHFVQRFLPHSVGNVSGQLREMSLYVGLQHRVQFVGFTTFLRGIFFELKEKRLLGAKASSVEVKMKDVEKRKGKKKTTKITRSQMRGPTKMCNFIFVFLSGRSVRRHY